MPVWNDTGRCWQLIDFDTATPTQYWKVWKAWRADWSEAELIRSSRGMNAGSVASEVPTTGRTTCVEKVRGSSRTASGGSEPAAEAS